MYFHIHAIWRHIWEGHLITSNHSRGHSISDRVVSMAGHSCASSDKGTATIMAAPPFIPFRPSFPPESHPLDTMSMNLEHIYTRPDYYSSLLSLSPLYASACRPPTIQQKNVALPWASRGFCSREKQVCPVYHQLLCILRLNSWPLSGRH